MKSIRFLLASFLVMSLSLSLLAGCGPKSTKGTVDVLAPNQIPDYGKVIDFDWSKLAENQRPEFYKWTEEYMYNLLSLKVLQESDLLEASREITRGEFIEWVVTAKLLDLVKKGHKFSDVPNDHPHHDAIITAAVNGIIEKTETFNPDAPLLRSDAAIYLVNASGEAAIEKAKTFTEPLIPAQDGYFEVPENAAGAMTTCYLPDFQLMNFRWKITAGIKDDFRYVMPEASMTAAEAAHSAYMLMYPPKRGGSIIIGQAQEPKTLFSGLDTMSAMSQITGLLYEGSSGGYDSQWAIFPIMMKRIPTQENGLWVIKKDEKGEFKGMEVTFEIRNGLKWADGSDILAEDFVFSHYLYNHPSFPTIHSEVDFWIDKMEAIDEHTLKVYWNKPYLFAYGASPMPRKYFEDKFAYHLDPFDINDPSYYAPPSEEKPDGFKSEKCLADEKFITDCSTDELYNTQPLHAGPYRVQKWEQGQTIILEANDHWIFGRPLLDTVTFRTIENTDTLLATAMAGNVDMTLTGLTFDQAQQLIGRKDVNQLPIFTPSLTWEHIDLNIDNPTLSDVRVRRALLHAMDREAISQSFFKGEQPVAHAWLPPKHPAFDDSTVTIYEFSPDKAKTLLDEAGWTLNPKNNIREKDGKPLQITFMTTAGNKAREQVQAVISSNWKDIGIDVITKNEAPTSFFTTTLQQRKFDGPSAFMYAWVMGPNSNMYSMANSKQIPTEVNGYSGQNYTSFKDETVDKLTGEILQSLSKQQNYENLKIIQQILTRDLPSLPLFYRLDVTTVHKDLVNYQPSGTQAATTWNAPYWYWNK
ncbi:MAG TPA: ABC transporter substrate-binding protein [Caldisericia bacterium]|nr:ABC transporter substrate-binding protein [Caldisericia bacterium]